MANKSKYETNVKPNLQKIQKLKLDGYREADIAKYLDVNPSKFSEYKKKYKELDKALKEGREELLDKLELTLYQKALAGNVTALIFTLKNMSPHKWADRQVVSQEGSQRIVIVDDLED